MRYAIVEFPINEEFLKSGLIAQTNKTARINNTRNKCVVSFKEAYLTMFRGYPTLAEYEITEYLLKFPEEWDADYAEPTKDANITRIPAFADKYITVNGVMKSLFKRVHGSYATVPAGQEVNLDFMIPYVDCKFSGADIFGCKLGDKVDFKVLDTINNDISKAPVGVYGTNLLLNQFGFNVEMKDGNYSNTSNYDASLFMGMVLRCTYKNNGGADLYIAVNFELHEVK